MSQAETAETVAIRTEIDGITGNVGAVRNAKKSTRLDLNVTSAERCANATEGGGDSGRWLLRLRRPR